MRIFYAGIAEETFERESKDPFAQTGCLLMKVLTWCGAKGTAIRQQNIRISPVFPFGAEPVPYKGGT
ncbi:MAG: hypothetical protein ACOC10_09880, partial [Bacteroidota bacterium]